jgi:hypothetical protein
LQFRFVLRAFLPAQIPIDLEFIDSLTELAAALATGEREIYWREMRTRQHLPIE